VEKMVAETGTLATPCITRWWGPRNYTLLFYEVDFLGGGGSRVCVISPEGRVHWIEGACLEIAEPERIVFRGDFDLDGARLTDMPLTFRRA
jgi:uncharacterized protein YndB with AHSA1/START domain